MICSGTDSSAHDNGLIRAINSNYKPNERVVGIPKYTIFVGRLHLKTDEVKWQEILINTDRKKTISFKICLFTYLSFQ